MLIFLFSVPKAGNLAVCFLRKSDAKKSFFFKCNYVANHLSVQIYDSRLEFNLTINNIAFIHHTHSFYRAMHFSAKRGIAIVCCPSVRPSVRP